MKPYLLASSIIALALFSPISRGAEAPVGNEHTMSKSYVAPKDPAVQKKLEWWQDLKFGLLMHWGTYSQWGIVESWSICPEDEGWCQRAGPYRSNYFAYVTAYENLRKTFNPVKFNPEKWVGAAKTAGMRYMVFTTKHHDGFCMFDTAQTDYRITAPDCPFHTHPRANIAKEVFAAFRKEGFGIGAYFSKPDWHSPYYWWPYFPPKDRNPNYDLSRYADRWQQFREFTWKQIEELMTGYGTVDILWLDGGQVRPPQQDIRMNELAAMARKHQPGLLVVDRTVSGENENYCTPENEVPGQLLPYPWETCMPMATSWSYVPNDKYKSAGTIVRHLCRIVARGGCLLLNIGPSPEGDFDPEAYDRLEKVGQWMKRNSEAIYETRPLKPYELGNWVFTSKRDGSVYAILLSKEDQERLPQRVEIPSEVLAGRTQVQLLGFGDLKVDETETGKPAILLPAAALAASGDHAWVFKLAPQRAR
jgi:alpha-L-fucosidase